MLASHWHAASPEEVGVDSDGLRKVFDRVRADVESGRLPSAQVAVARGGKLAGIATYGFARQGGRRQPAGESTLYCVYSTTKGAVAAALWALMERGDLDLQQRVGDIVPEFDTCGKEAVRVWHLVTHTAGFPRASLHPNVWDERRERLAAFSRWRLDWEPGSRFEYHPTSAHWVLAEIIERRSGQPFQNYIRDRVLVPAGLDEFFLGLPPERDDRVAEVEQVAAPADSIEGSPGLESGELLAFNQPETRRVGLPGGGGITGAGELAMLYQPLIRGGASAAGTRVLGPEAIAAGTRVLTDERHVDPVMRVPVNRAAGVVVAGDDGRAKYRGFGTASSPFAFGHGGAGGQIAWGDPVSGISLGVCTNGLGPWLETGKRARDLSTLASECALPLA